MEFIKPLIDNRGEILLTAFCVGLLPILLYVLFRIYYHLKNIDKNLWITSHDTYDFLEDIHGELVRLEAVIASSEASFNEVHQLEIDELIAKETHQLSRDRRGSYRGWASKHGSKSRYNTLEDSDADIRARAMEISRLLRVLRLKNEKGKYHETDFISPRTIDLFAQLKEAREKHHKSNEPNTS